MASKKVLVIEDNPKNMKLVRALLLMGEYRVLEAETAEDGLKMAREEKPDLVLMDLQLPGMDGLEATRSLKAEDAFKQTPVVALTSHAMEGDDEKARQAGCDGYVTKPIDTRSFLDTIEQYAGRSKKSEGRVQPPMSGGGRARILIVDDDPRNLKLMAGMLAGKTYQMMTATDGSEALKLVEQDRPDLILLDVMMPGLNGYDVTRRIKSNPATQSIPIILVTALDSSEDKVMGLEAGAEEFLTKPVNAVEIEARIRSMLKLKQYRDQLAIRTESESPIQTVQSIPEGVAEKETRSRVLVVEDDEKDLKLLLNHLENPSYDLDTARNGQDAIQKMVTNPYDLVILDILLPRIDGFEICRRIKQMEETQDTQVVLITCLKDLENKIKGVELGADDYLMKPVDPRELQARVKVLLKKKAYLDSLHSHYKKAVNSALMDGLTGLYNHSYFKRFLDLEIKRSQRQGHATSLLMVDVDDFKQINDTMGHMTGDRILNSIGQNIKNSIREIDVAARYGGEEFAVVLPYGNRDAATIVGHRVQKVIADHPFPAEEKDVFRMVTVSIGGAVYPDDAESADALIEIADRMLYRAKREGKNRVVIFN